MGSTFRAFAGRPLGAFSLATVLLLVAAAILAELLAPRGFAQQFRGFEFRPPMTVAPDGALLLLGADDLGRDLFSRLLHGARISVYVGMVSVAGALAIGTLFGTLGAYVGGLTDALLQRVVDVFMSIPVLVLAMVIATALGAGINGVILAVIIIQWPRVARVVRGDVLLAKELPFVESARAVGANHVRIVWHHILRNVVSSIIILATTNVGNAILIEAGLAFLTVGATPPTPSWGLMITDARPYLTRDPKLFLAPGIALSLVVLAFNLGGDVLRDVLDPRQKRERGPVL
jgi:ABC-type dipeptide/oligopeptide/nickel transport system permease subunit